jgi:hypothetical protein
MEEKIVVWSVAVFVAGFAALIIYGCTMDLFDGETIRKTAETGIVFIAVGFTATFLKG